MKASEKMAKESAYQSKRQQVLAARPEDMGLALRMMAKYMRHWWILKFRWGVFALSAVWMELWVFIIA